MSYFDSNCIRCTCTALEYCKETFELGGQLHTGVLFHRTNYPRHLGKVQELEVLPAPRPSGSEPSISAVKRPRSLEDAESTTPIPTESNTRPTKFPRISTSKKRLSIPLPSRSRLHFYWIYDAFRPFFIYSTNTCMIIKAFAAAEGLLNSKETASKSPQSLVFGPMCGNKFPETSSK
ncbi:uncharacterized protein MELLADRAFT_109988 [Melampsora larici-populina 98AG31]|uniref:Uncharacterized protein n=1 Tax=Melampsora larici-populina (strain 98AG31 / pathotype 3-4-7) TaxID=747676 RepID=F4RYA1_MELLP|nr:uncharacterized protein MELLADRAFT_109988 [Melampsora larici-populina 98AG31]EGG02674.1 hypothetical protein MELLADRAFT_109988 [Melampsora larici-populina 98AG31]